MTVDLWALPGQRRAADVLRSAVAREETGHAWAFLGPKGVGQQEAARALVAALNCPQPVAAGTPCGTCDVCERCRRGAYAAYREFHPTGTSHRVDDVRSSWLQTASRSVAEGRFKVLRIRDADRMNEAAANAFLKGLEEPPERTIWILDVADPDELPDTILSRCRTLRFSPWSHADLVDEAERLGVGDVDERELAARVAAGSPEALARLAAPGALDDVRAHRALLSRLRVEGPGYAVVAARRLDEEVKRRTDELKEAGRAELEQLAQQYGDQLPRAVTKQLAEQLSRREREVRALVLQAALDDVLAWLRDCVLLTCAGEPGDLIHRDAVQVARSDAALGPARLLAAIDLVLATRERLELNVQTGLALEALFMELSALAIGGSVGPSR